MVQIVFSKAHVVSLVLTHLFPFVDQFRNNSRKTVNSYTKVAVKCKVFGLTPTF